MGLDVIWPKSSERNELYQIFWDSGFFIEEVFSLAETNRRGILTDLTWNEILLASLFHIQFLISTKFRLHQNFDGWKIYENITSLINSIVYNSCLLIFSSYHVMWMKCKFKLFALKIKSNLSGENYASNMIWIITLRFKHYVRFVIPFRAIFNFHIVCHTMFAWSLFSTSYTHLIPIINIFDKHFSQLNKQNIQLTHWAAL